ERLRLMSAFHPLRSLAAAGQSTNLPSGSVKNLIEKTSCPSASFEALTLCNRQSGKSSMKPYALSRLKHGFDSRRGHQRAGLPGAVRALVRIRLFILSAALHAS